MSHWLTGQCPQPQRECAFKLISVRDQLTGVVKALALSGLPCPMDSAAGVRCGQRRTLSGVWLDLPKRKLCLFWWSSLEQVHPLLWLVFCSEKWVRLENLQSLFHLRASRILWIRSISSVWTFPYHAQVYTGWLDQLIFFKTSGSSHWLWSLAT